MYAALHVANGHFDAMQLALSFGVRETVALVALGVTARRYLRISWAELGLHGRSWTQIAIGVALGLVVMVLSTALLAAIDLHGDVIIVRAAANGTRAWQAALFVMIALYSPVVQELIFRGLLLQGLLQRTNAAVAVTASATVFALIHTGSGVASVLNAFFFGVLQGALFVRFRSLAAPIASHVAVNSVSMLRVFAALR